MLRAGEMEVRSLLQACFPVERAETAFELAARPGILKVILEVPEVRETRSSLS